VRDAGRIGKKLKALGVRRVAIAGGDGTAHELIEGVLAEGRAQWQLILLPLGTANALYSSLFRLADPQDKLHSLRAFLNGDEPKALPITTTNIKSLAPIHSHVVASFALHAAILRDSETMREKYPGVERFKMAAHKNAGVFFDADVDLLPTRDGHVLQYDPASAEFKATASHLTGPFAYFLATATTPRLEPTFVIAPLLERMPPSSPSMDIIIIRPMNDPAIASLEPEERGAKWAERAWEVLGWAYKEGGHVDLTYGDQLESRGDGPVVVETFRCGGFKWTPKVRKLFKLRVELNTPVLRGAHILCRWFPARDPCRWLRCRTAQ
jgi:hypothetical protein